MAENIALEKSSQSTFANAVKNIKLLMKENEEFKFKEISRPMRKVPTAKKVLGKKKKRKTPRKILGRGVVYLSHIPKGFYEEEMLSYFNQFGRVTRLNVVRSKVTGKPKGYAFIEFLYSEVAQVVAETMNNYLMFGKILKAQYIPGDEVRPGMFSHSKTRPENCQRSMARNKWIEKTNKLLTDEEVSEMAAHELKRLNKFKKQMQDSGIDFDCQVEGGAISILNNSNAVVLELNEIKTGVELNINPTLLKQKNRKRSLSTSSTGSTPEKKRMTLLQSLKSKKGSPVQSPIKSPTNLDKTPILKLKRLDQFSSRSTEKLRKSSFIPSSKGRLHQLSSRSAEKLKNTPSIFLNKERLDQLSSQSAEDLKNLPSMPPKKERMNALSTKSAEKFKNTPSILPKEERLDEFSSQSAEDLKNSPSMPPKKERMNALPTKSAGKLKNSPSILPKEERLDELSSQSAEDLKNSPSMPPKKERMNALSTKSAGKLKNSPSILPKEERLSSRSAKKLKNSPSMTPNKEILNALSTKSAGKLKNSPSILPKEERLDQLSSRSAKKLKKSPSIFPNKENSSPKLTPEKIITPKMSSASKRTLRDKKQTKTPALSVKKLKSSDGSIGKQSTGSMKKAKTPVSAKKGKKSPLLVGRRLVFSTTKKSLASRLTRKMKPIKMKTP